MPACLSHGTQVQALDNGIETVELENNCPACGSGALYKYGTAHTGKKRLLCMICGRQFTLGAKKTAIENKPLCSDCGRPMNINGFEGELIRLRCSGYPECRAFKKFRLTEERK